MSPSKPDASAKTNAKLLAEFTNAKIFSLPWLCKEYSAAEILKNPPVKQTLAALFPDGG